MGEVHRLPTARDAAARLLERLVVDTIANHPDRRVAERWSALARESIARHAGPPLPTRPALELGVLRALPREVRDAVVNAAEDWMSSYFADVRAELLTMQREMLSLQKRVAELEVALEDAKADADPGP